MTDERAGLPSASGMERLKLCPGSWALEQQCPDPQETEEAASGTRIHDAWAGKLDQSELTWDEDQTLEFIRDLEEKALKAVFPDCTPDLIVNDDSRLLLTIDGVRRMSGRPDKVYSSNGSALILDAKTGRLDAPIAAENVQLRALATLLDQETGWTLHSITVGILAPWQSQRITLARYERHHLDAARQEILDIIAASKKPDAPRNPSLEACRYCKAKAVCPEARESAMTLPVAETPELPTATRTPEAFAAMLTRDELGACLRRGKLFEKIYDAMKAEAKRRLESGEEVPGWILREGRETEVITDPQKVWEGFLELGGNSKDFMGCVRITKGDLKEKVRHITGTKGRGLDAQMALILDGATTTKKSAKQLEEV